MVALVLDRLVEQHVAVISLVAVAEMRYTFAAVLNAKFKKYLVITKGGLI
jgi:hypothetical protein